MRALIASEYDESVCLVDYCKAKKILIVHVPNGMASNAREGARFKRMGLMKGFPDFFVPYARNGKHGLFVELKRKAGAYVKPEQQAWLDLLNEAGYKAIVCRGADCAIREIENYLSDVCEDEKK